MERQICNPWLLPWEMTNVMMSATTVFNQYVSDFYQSFLTSLDYFGREEGKRFWTRSPAENFLAYSKIGMMNMNMAGRASSGILQATEQFLNAHFPDMLSIIATGDLAAYQAYVQKFNKLLEGVASTYPKAIANIEPEYGFHFELQAKSLVDETDRFELRQVFPTDPKVKVRPDGKPILIIPPYVLGPNILGFLPGENRSYAHTFANQGIPCYIRVMKDIQDNEAVQLTTPEDDARDTRKFCETIMKRHERPVALNGYCQGGYLALCNLLSGKLDGLVDAFITCVSPMDGTRSKGLVEFLQSLPAIFNNLNYGIKALPNGNQVADGRLMGWIYKLKSIEQEAPPIAMLRDMTLAGKADNDPTAISKTAAAINYWLINERSDLPLEITKVSFAAYNIPITSDGTLPVRLFGKKLNLKRMADKKIPWLICYGKNDDLVEPETALAPLVHVEAEVTPFPKGHVAIATSWSHPESAYALHTRFPDGTRGPVRFQLDLEKRR